MNDNMGVRGSSTPQTSSTPQEAKTKTSSEAQQKNISKKGEENQRQMQESKPVGFTHKVKQLASEFKEGAVSKAKKAKEAVMEKAGTASTKIGDKAGAIKDKATSLGKSIIGKSDKAKELRPFDYVITDEGVENPLSESDKTKLSDMGKRRNQLNEDFGTTLRQVRDSGDNDKIDKFRNSMDAYRNNLESYLRLEKQVVNDPQASNKEREQALSLMDGHLKVAENVIKHFKNLP